MEGDEINFMQTSLIKPELSPLIGYGYKIQDRYKLHTPLG